MEKFHLKSTRISYLDSKIIEQFAIVKLISIESKEFIQINPLCLAAICPAFAQMDFEDPQEDFKILTEYSIQDLEQIVKFCHGEAIPQESSNIPKIFQDFGIDVISFMRTVKQEEPLDVKEDLINFLQDAIGKTPPESINNLTKPILPIKKKRGRPRKNPDEIKNNFAEINDEVDDNWGPEMYQFLEDQYFSEQNSSESSDDEYIAGIQGKRNKTSIKKKSKKRKQNENWGKAIPKEEIIEDQDQDEKSSDKSNNMLNRFKRGRPKKPPPMGAEKIEDLEHVDDISKLDEETLANFNLFQFPKPVDTYLEKPRMQDLEKYIPQEEAAYACHLCPKRFLKENSLRKHCILIHSSHYNCPFCEVSFGLDDEEGFRFHMFKHEHSGPLKCIQCGYLTYNRRKFISHVESLGDVHDNKCTQCNEVMNTFDEHILHLHQVHEGQRKYKCGICFELFPQVETLKDHRRIVHQKKRAERVFTKRKSETQAKPKLPKSAQICDLCGVTVKNLISHRQYRHMKEDIPCDECGEIFRSATHLKTHVNSTHNINPCPVCGEMVAKKKLFHHVQVKHTANQDRKYKCDVCGKGFLDNQKLNDHKNTHTGEKPYACKFCGVAFANRSNCNAHENSHRGIKRRK